MPKVKAIVIGVIVLLFFSMGVSIQILSRKYKAEKADRERLSLNNMQLMSENRQNIDLKLTLREFKASMSTKIDSILKVAEIASKQVKTITVNNTYYIDSSKTVIRPEPDISKTDTTYPFIDIKDCFTIGGFMKVQDDRPELIINKREFKNEVTIIGYEKRPHKFWFVRWGKKQTYIETSSDCGETKTTQIEIVKK